MELILDLELVCGESAAEICFSYERIVDEFSWSAVAQYAAVEKDIGAIRYR